MPRATKSRRAGEADSRAPAGPLLDLLASGASIDQIASQRNRTRQRTESILRAELKAISIRPTRDYAKLQIRRLDALVGKLTEKANAGEFAAIDRILKVLDRLDRYHGFVKSPAKPDKNSEPAADEKDDEAFDRKLAELLRRRTKAGDAGDGETAAGEDAKPRAGQ